MVYTLTQWCLGSTEYRLGKFSKPYLLPDLLYVILVVAAWVFWGHELQTVALAILLLITSVVSITDFRFNVIPDRLTLPGITLGLLLLALAGLDGFVDALIGGMVGFALFYLAAVIGEKLLKKPAMGGGDIKLATMLGMFLGWYPLLLSVSLAALLALLYAVTKRVAFGSAMSSGVPFGPFLSLSATITYLLSQSWSGFLIVS